MSKPIRLSKPELIEAGQEIVVATNLTGCEPAGQIRFRLPSQYAPDETSMSDSLFPIGLLLSLATGQRLELDSPVSEQMVKAGKVACEIYTNWFPTKLTPVAIDVPVRSDSPLSRTGASRGLSAFTGGVDSFTTALRNRENVDTLFYVFGYDLPLNTEFRALRDNVKSHLQRAADAMRKRVIFVTTNVRTFLNPHLNWAAMSHGPAIATVAHLLSHMYDTLYIPSSFTYKDLHPWGSHPLTDRLWSSDRLQVAHDSAHLSRVQKTLQIAGEPAVKKHLRVCLSKRTDYNCGKCVKCLRTMLGLELAGGLADTEVFPTHLDLSMVRDIELTTNSQFIFMQELLEHARTGGRSDIADAVMESINRFASASQQ